MKEDILEQLTEDYLRHLGYFTQHNVKFRPADSHPDYVSKADSSYSDIDVVGVHPHRGGVDHVWAVSCKSWQGGFRPARRIEKIEEGKKVSGRKAWKAFRELVVPKWAEAFREKVNQLTGSADFTYVTAVTRLVGDKCIWEEYQPFVDALGAPIRVVTFKEMLNTIWADTKTTLASSDVGRTLQLIKASSWSMPK